MQSFLQKERKLYLGSKIHCLGILGMEFEKAIIIFETSTLESVKVQCFMRKQGALNLRQKTSYLGIFVNEFKKSYCYI